MRLKPNRPAKILISCGVFLVVVQLLALLGGIISDEPFFSTIVKLTPYNAIVYLVTFFFIGIVGAVLIAIGVSKKNKGK
ncbi:MAG TPA: hypothetical protein PKJ02_04770 [Candidatus Avimonas sp.]|jgi:cadmium resistance protein CadD (predicted permease)|nr:hypothetical protein [Candidatus Avimonas sp.]